MSQDDKNVLERFVTFSGCVFMLASLVAGLASALFWFDWPGAIGFIMVVSGLIFGGSGLWLKRVNKAEHEAKIAEEVARRLRDEQAQTQGMTSAQQQLYAEIGRAKREWTKKNSWGISP